MRKAAVLVECASDRLALRAEMQRTGAGLARFRNPLGWLTGARSLFGGGNTREPEATGWNWPALVQSAVKAFAAYQAVRGFFARKREKRRERSLMGRLFSR